MIDGTAYVIIGRTTGPYGEEYEVPFRNDGMIDLAPGTVNAWTILNRTTFQNAGTIGSSGELKNEGSAVNDCGATITMPVTGNPVEQLPCNAAPVVEAGADQAVDEGASMSISSASFTDADAAPHTATVDWGDGIVSDLGSVTPCPIYSSHTYGDDGIYGVTVCVADSEPLDGCDTFEATVRNVAPEVTGQAVAAEEGTEADGVLASLTDGGIDDTHQATVDWGDGTGPQSATVSESGGSGTVTAGHTYGDDGSFTVIVCVADDAGGETCAVVAADIANASPVVAMSEPLPYAVYQVGQTIPLEGSFTDAGFLDSHNATWTLQSSDRSAPASIPGTVVESGGSGSVTANAQLSEAGLYQIALSVSDDDGGSSSTTLVNGVEAVMVVFDPSGGFVTGGGWFDKGSGTINGQGQYEFMLRAVDDDAGDTFRIRIWEEIAGVEVVMYDNGSQQPIGAGNILVQSGGGR